MKPSIRQINKDMADKMNKIFELAETQLELLEEFDNLVTGLYDAVQDIDRQGVCVDGFTGEIDSLRGKLVDGKCQAVDLRNICLARQFFGELPHEPDLASD